MSSWDNNWDFDDYPDEVEFPSEKRTTLGDDDVPEVTFTVEESEAARLQEEATAGRGFTKGAPLQWRKANMGLATPIPIIPGTALKIPLWVLLAGAGAGGYYLWRRYKKGK